MNEMESKNFFKKFFVLKDNQDISAKNLKNSTVHLKKREISDRNDPDHSSTGFILEKTQLKSSNKKEKLGSHRLSELQSFRSKFK